MSYGAEPVWSNLTVASPVEIWVSGAITLRRSVDLEGVFSMAARYELTGELLAGQGESVKYLDRLFVWKGAERATGEIAKAAFLARAGKVCAVEMSASNTLERLLQSVFEEYLQAVEAKIRAWKKRAGT
jgi:hypothetical protein